MLAADRGGHPPTAAARAAESQRRERGIPPTRADQLLQVGFRLVQTGIASEREPEVGRKGGARGGGGHSRFPIARASAHGEIYAKST